jgi:ceramide glucosyltransferase
MNDAAQHNILVITDSDVRVTPQYLRAVVAPFREASTGLVTCVYRGVAAQGGFWARLEGLGMSIEMTSGVLVADMLEGMRFALGPSMVVRKRCVDEIGGFEKLGHYYADDFMLGNLVSEHGNSVILSNHVIDHCIVNTTFEKSLTHQWNWMKSTRFSRPLGHLGTGLTFAVPFGLLSCGRNPTGQALYRSGGPSMDRTLADAAIGARGRSSRERPAGDPVGMALSGARPAGVHSVGSELRKPPGRLEGRHL